LALTLTLSAAALADPVRHLGSTRLTHHENDVDVITFKNCRAGVNAVQVRVRRGNVEIESIWVQFANGERDTLSVRDRIARGGESRWIDVRGGERCITAIGVIGDTENSRKQARVDVYGR
jgi:hypothetical protein